MINSTYGAGFRAGFARPALSKPRADGTRLILEPVCPFPSWRFISFALWHSGRIDGQMKRLVNPNRKTW
jgi:hypothetical protein